jgi:hypothetical protein
MRTKEILTNYPLNMSTTKSMKAKKKKPAITKTINVLSINSLNVKEAQPFKFKNSYFLP